MTGAQSVVQKRELVDLSDRRRYYRINVRAEDLSAVLRTHLRSSLSISNIASLTAESHTLPADISSFRASRVWKG